jgi:hypothetical protein
VYVYLRALFDDGPLLECSVYLLMTARSCRVMNVLSFKSQRGYRAGPDDRRWVSGDARAWLREPDDVEYGQVGSSAMMVECHPQNTSEGFLSALNEMGSITVVVEESASEIDRWIHGSVDQYLTSVAVLQAVRSLIPAHQDARLVAEPHPSMMSEEHLFFQITRGMSLASTLRLLRKRPIRGLLRPDFPLYGMVETSWP